MEDTTTERKHKKHGSSREGSSREDARKEGSSREDSIKRKERREKKRAQLEGNDIELESSSSRRSSTKRESTLEKSPSKKDASLEKVSSKKDEDPDKTPTKKVHGLEKAESKKLREHHHHEKRERRHRREEKGIVSKKEKVVTIYTPSRLSMDVRSSKGQVQTPIVNTFANITKVENPTITHHKKTDENTGEVGLLVKIECPTPNAQIYYTFNGVAPNHNSFKYNITGPFVCTESTTLSVVAMVRQKNLISAVVTENLVV